jgi:hypothetical protein
MRRPSWLIVPLLLMHLAMVGGVYIEAAPLPCTLSWDCQKAPSGADFYALVHAATNIAEGRSPYDDAPDGRTPDFYAYRYLPSLAWLARPLARVSPQGARLAWVLLVEGFLLAVLLALWRSATSPRRWLLAVALPLLSVPYAVELHMGQFTFVVVAALVLALLLPRAGPLVALSVFIKTFTLVATPALLRQRRWWPWLALTAVVVLLPAWAWFHTHPQDWAFFRETNLANPRPAYDEGNTGLVAFAYNLVCARWGTPSVAGWNRAVSLVRLPLLGLTAAVVLLSRERRVLLGASTLLLAHFVTYQHVWEHHMSAVVLLGAALVATVERREGLLVPALLCTALLALPTPIGLVKLLEALSGWDTGLRQHALRLFLPSLAKGVPTLLLYLVLLLRLLREGLGRPRIGR